MDRQVAFAALIRVERDARVVAIAKSALVVPMPAAVPLGGRATIDGIVSMLDVVHPSDARTLIATWDEMKRHGIAATTVRAWHAADRGLGLHFFDLIDVYGVVLCVVTGYRDAGPPPEPAPVVPRIAVMRKDELSYITAVDEGAVALLGWSADELVGRRSQELVHPEDEEIAVSTWLRMLFRPGSAAQVRLRHRHRDGGWRWLEVTNHNNLAAPGDPHILAEMVDVTAEVDAVNALRTNEHMLRRLAEALPVGVLYVEADRRISYRNARLRTLAGVDMATDIDAQFAHLVGREAAMAAFDAALTSGEDADLEVSLHPPGARLRRCHLSLRPVANQDGRVVGAITCLTDVTDDANHREDLERRVRYDPLTSCLNHSSILTELERRLADPLPGLATVVAFIDLDEFKAANDRFGHREGDRLLKHVADQLWRVAGDDGLVGRVGGDEFLMVVSAPPDGTALAALAGRVAAALDVPIVLQGESIRPRGSIGLAYGLGAVGDADGLVALADQAMYQSKRRGDGLPIIAELGGVPA